MQDFEYAYMVTRLFRVWSIFDLFYGLLSFTVIDNYVFKSVIVNLKMVIKPSFLLHFDVNGWSHGLIQCLRYVFGAYLPVNKSLRDFHSWVLFGKILTGSFCYQTSSTHKKQEEKEMSGENSNSIFGNDLYSSKQSYHMHARPLHL